MLSTRGGRGSLSPILDPSCVRPVALSHLRGDAGTSPTPYVDASPVSLATTAGDVEVVACFREGSGAERFLLLHGNPGSMLDLAALLSPLSEMGSVAAYDAPGFGRSPTPAKESALTIDASAELAVRMLDHLGWPDAVIVGHSHGGGVAQRVARRWPERVRGLVLLGTLGAPAHLTYRLFPLPGVETVLAGAGWLLPRLPRASARRLVRYFMDLNYAPSQAAPEEVAHEHELLCDNPHVLRNMARVTRGEPCVLLDDDAPQIAAPTLFLHGERDQIVPLRHARRIYERMTEAGRRARFVAIPHAGHMLAAQEPGRCVEAIRELLTT